MLGNGTQGDSGQIEALGGDAIDQLLGRIRGDTDAGGGDGAGNNGGDEGGGGGSDPYDAPATIKMLLDAARQMANFQSDLTMRTAETLTEAIVKGRATGQEQMLEMARQLHDNAMRMSNVVATRLEAVEERLLAIEAYLGGKPAPRASGAGDDAGGGP